MPMSKSQLLTSSTTAMPAFLYSELEKQRSGEYCTTTFISGKFFLIHLHWVGVSATLLSAGTLPSFISPIVFIMEGTKVPHIMQITKWDCTILLSVPLFLGFINCTISMNYFELFGLPVQLKMDKALVRKKYLELSRASHPDYFINDASEKQQEVLETSATLNKALKTLTTDDEIIKYVLTHKNLLEQDEKFALPPGFLMEMMELNEALVDSGDDDASKEDLKRQLETLQAEMYGTVKGIIEDYKEGITTPEELLQVKEYYFKKKYLERLKDQLAQKS